MDPRKLGAGIVILSFFVVGVPLPNSEIQFPMLLIESAALAVLLFTPTPMLHGASLRRTVTAWLVLVLVVLLYFWLRQVRPQFGTEAQYLGEGLKLAVFLSLITAYTVRLYDERIFLEVFWSIGTKMLVVALGAYFFAAVTGIYVLANNAYGGARVHGFLSEPSAWAAPSVALLLLALGRRAWVWAALAAVGAVLTKSPTVMVTAAVALPLYYLIHHDRVALRKAVAILAVATIGPLAAYKIQHTDPAPYLASTSTYKTAFGRFVSGINNVKTSGQEGANARFEGGQTTVREVRENHLEWTGYGLGSSNIYLLKKFQDTEAWSMFYSVLFDFGYVGAGLLVLLVLVAIVRTRRRPVLAVFLPFAVAAMVNSAEGWIAYAFVVIPVVAYVFRWAPAGPEPEVRRDPELVDATV